MYIDCRIGLDYVSKDGITDSIRFLKHRKDHNIRYSLAHAVYSDCKSNITNEEIKNIVKKHSPYLIGVGAVNMNDFRSSFKSVKTNCINGIFRAIKFEPVEQNIMLNQLDLNKVYSFCQNYMIPLFFSFSSTKPISKDVLIQIEKILLKFPYLIIIVSNFGPSSVYQILKFISKYKNKVIYIDTSGIHRSDDTGNLTGFINKYKKYNLPVERILFGLGSFFPRPDSVINEIENSRLSPEEKTGVFYENAKKLFKITRQYKKGNFRNRIYQLWINPLHECNKQCSFCYERNQKKSFRHMRLEEFKKIVKKARQEKILKIILSGGEPTLWPDLDKAIKFAKKNNIKVELYTNGTRPLGRMQAPDEIHINLNSCLTNIKSQIEGMAKEGISLKGEFTISQNTSISQIKKILEDTKDYKLIILSLDVTETNRKKNIENFNKAVRFKDKDKVVINLHTPSCQLTGEQNFIARVYPNIREENCFPGWEDIVIDNDLTARSCIGSKTKIKLNEKIPFSRYPEILFNKVRKELDKSPFKKCKRCYYFKARLCTGGCIIWKDMRSGKKGFSN